MPEMSAEELSAFLLMFRKHETEVRSLTRMLGIEGGALEAEALARYGELIADFDAALQRTIHSGQADGAA